MSTSNSQGRVAVVTGASSGIGEATARALAADGYRVALLARRLDRITALAEKLGDCLPLDGWGHMSGSGSTLLSAGGTFGPDATVPVDLFFDASVELAFEATRWLQEVHGGPPLEEAPGILGTLLAREGP